MTETVDRNSVLPRYAQARLYVEELIRTVPYRPGDQLPSQRDLAAKFNVAQMTMYKAIETMVRDGILTREIGRGTFVAERREGAVTLGPLGLVSVLNPGDVALDPYASELLRGVQAGAAEVGRDLLLVQEPLYKWEGAGQSLHGRADGFLIMASSDKGLPALRRLRRQSVPFLSLGSSWFNEDVPAVDSDNVQGARDAVQHLVDLGHTRIGMIGALESMSNSVDRREGVRQALEQHGLENRDDWFILSEVGGPLTDDDRARLVDMVRSADGPTAVICAGYGLAVDGIRTLQEEGLSVPVDVSIVGFDDTFSAAFLTPPLTTVAQPLREMGRRAALRLDAMLSGQDTSAFVERLPTSLVVRGSTAPPRRDGVWYPDRITQPAFV